MIDELVKKLSESESVIIIGYKEESNKEIKERIEEGYIHIKFIQTKGGTELGINVDHQLTSLKNADFESGKGILHLSGTCELNFQKVRCIADINLETRQGLGYIKLLDEQTVKSKSNMV